MEKVHYIAFYDTANNKNENRQTSLSATNKIDYICSALLKNGYKVEIVSPSWTNNISGYYKGEVRQLSDDVKLRTFATFGGRNKILRISKYFFSLSQLLLYLLINTKKNESIIVYHSILLSVPIRVAKFFKRFKIILEVEEIYDDVQSLSKNMRISEYKTFTSADKFIFSTELLNEKLNSTNKPSTLIYGTYQVEEIRKCRLNDGKIHAVYAGTFDPRKGGALAAAAAAADLPNNYHVHIIGFGSEKEKEDLKDLINDISKTTECTITYDGLLKGEDYIRFLQSCHIGLSTQTPDATYNNTSFPSKILSYMSNGLRVVSVRIKAIEMSAIGDAISYYEDQSPSAIANAIMLIDINQPNNNVELIKRLDEEFVQNIKDLLRS